MPYRVALVEDNQDHVYLISRILREHRQISAVDVFPSAEAALEGMTDAAPDGRGAPDIILLDLKLPGMSGQDLLSKLRSDGRLAGVPVFILTSSDRVSDRQACEEIGIQGYYLKPFLDDDLDALLASLAEVSPDTG